MSEVAAGYYQDPEDPGFERYWNGAAWTGVRRPQPGSGTRSRKGSWFGGRANRDRQAQPSADVEHADLEQARAEIGRLRQQLAEVGGFELGELRRLRDQLVDEVADQQQRLDALQAEIVTTQDEQILQEIGIYDYRHPLTDAVAYREALRVLQGEIKAMARRDGAAIEASLSWHVNGSLTEGRKAIREYSKLMLRAYNAEADNLVRGNEPLRRSRKTGAKHHILTCGNGLPIAIAQSAANVNDHLVLPELLDRVRPLRGRPGRPREKITALIADKGYDYPRVYDELEQRRITAYIPRRVNVANPQMHFDLVVKSDLLSTSR